MYKITDFIAFPTFANIHEFADECATVKRNKALWDRDFTAGFCETSNFVDAESLLRKGWPEGVRHMTEAMQVCGEGIGRYMESVGEFDVRGPVFVNGLYCAGDPECLYTPAIDSPEPVINVVIESNALGGVSAEQLNNRGGAILGLVERLEEAGRAVQITAVCTAEWGGPNRRKIQNGNKNGRLFGFAVRVKDAGEPLNMHALAYSMVASSFYRRHGFKLASKYCSKFNAGSSYTKSLRQVEDVAASLGQVDLHFINASTAGEHNFDTPDKATDWVISQATQQGVLK